MTSESTKINPEQLDRERIEKLLEILPSFALLAGLQLGLFTTLDRGSATAIELAGIIGVNKRRLRELLHALTSIQLLKIEQDATPTGESATDEKEVRFRNSVEASRFLVSGKPSYVGGHEDLLAIVWESALKSADSIRAGQPKARKDFARMPEEELARFLGGLHLGAVERGREMASTKWLGNYRRVADIGGGSGGLAIGLAKELPHLQATVFELPSVTNITQKFVSQADVATRIDILPVDFGLNSNMHSLDKDCISQKFDAAIMVSFIQVLSPEHAGRAIVKSFDILRPGGFIYIIGVGILDDNRITPVNGSLFNLIFSSIYEDGRSYTISEHRNWLNKAGFKDIKLDELSDGTPVIRATKP